MSDTRIDRARAEIEMWEQVAGFREAACLAVLRGILDRHTPSAPEPLSRTQHPYCLACALTYAVNDYGREVAWPTPWPCPDVRAVLDALGIGAGDE